MSKVANAIYLSPENIIEDESNFVGNLPPLTSPVTSPVASEVETAERKPPPEIKAYAPQLLTSLQENLKQLADLVANVTEAYSVVIFLVDENDKALRPVGVHTLSREFNHEARIGFGCGLVGWTAAQGLRISVSPFEHDATTLQYYTCDQALKSFIAVPIFDSAKKLIGVISCDSKKNYAFAKLTEKILLDCASQARTIIELTETAKASVIKNTEPTDGEIKAFLDSLRDKPSEKALLEAACDVPENLIQRDALVVMVTQEQGVGEGTFYSRAPEARIEHRLLELVCKHKKVICRERSVHVLPVDDIKQRSFLSVPLQVLSSEAGSLNILSRPHHAFQAGDIAVLEKVARVVGSELERIRLRLRYQSSTDVLQLLPWKHFTLQAQARLERAKQERQQLALVRLELQNMKTLEAIAGVEITAAIATKILRFVSQLVRNPALATSLYGNGAFILAEKTEADAIITRLRRLIERGSVQDFLPDSRSGAAMELGNRLAALINECLVITTVAAPKGVSVNIQDLLQQSRGESPKQIVGPAEQKPAAQPTEKNNSNKSYSTDDFVLGDFVLGETVNEKEVAHAGRR